MPDITGQPKFTSIVLTWSAPLEPNGVIISYEVTYRDIDGNLVTTNIIDLSTTFTIPSLTPGTNVTDISVNAFTSVGREDPVNITRLMSLTAPREYRIFMIESQTWTKSLGMVCTQTNILGFVYSGTNLKSTIAYFCT